MEVFLSLFVLVIAVLLACLKYQHTYWSRRGIPHDTPHFLYGNMCGWRKTKHLTDIFEPVYAKYKGSCPFVGFYFVLKPAVLLLDLELIKKVLVADFKSFADKGFFNNERDDPLTATITSISGCQWQTRRNLITPLFTLSKMRKLFPAVREVGTELIGILTEQVNASDDNGLEIMDLMGRLTADVIGRCAFGYDCHSLSNPSAEFFAMGRRVFNDCNHSFLVDSLIKGFPDLARKLRMRQLHPDCHAFYMRIVRETLEHRERNNLKCNDYMGLLIELKEKGVLSFNELVAQAYEFFVSGFVGASATLGYGLYELAQNQHVQEKLRTEVQDVLERHNNEFTYEAMLEMPYMEQVISETLRKYPIGTLLVRKADAHYETDDPKYYIEKGTMVLIPVSAIHHDPELYPEPHKFDPERFSKDEVIQRHSCAWMAFGEGPRQCIGISFARMQLVIAFVYLISNFKFSTCKQTQPYLKFMKTPLELIPEGGIYLRVETMENNNN